MYAEPGRLLVFPYRTDDPYLNLLCLAPRAAGWQIRTSIRYSDFSKQLGEVVPGEIIHIHWTSSILPNGESEANAAIRMQEFQTSLDAALDRGGVLIWTIHQFGPSGGAHPELERDLGHFLAARAASVHVLSASGEIEAQLHYGIAAEKIVRMPRASYAGIYDQSLSRSEARLRLGLADSEKAVLFFGRMRATKGLDTLCAAVQAAGERGEELVLLVAGEAHTKDIAEMESYLPTSARIIREHGHVSDESVQDWFAGADVAVFPHSDALNSGIVTLAATFGLPVIIPRPDRVPPNAIADPWITFYDVSEAIENLASAIADFDDASEVLANSARAFAARFSPFEMSRGYLAALRTM